MTSSVLRGDPNGEKKLGMPLAALCLAALAGTALGSGEPVKRAHDLKCPAKMEMLRPGEVKPRGWLRDWCVVARNGYVSRLGEIDANINRAWCTGYEPRGTYLNWWHKDKGSLPFDNAAYWMEGLTRLAWQLDDDKLKQMAKEKFERILSSMNPKAIGFIHWLDRSNPAHMKEVEDASHGFIIGSCGRLARGLISYYEATGDKRALSALNNALNEPRIYFLGGPVAIPQEAIDAWCYSGDPSVAAALDHFYANVPSQKAWNPTRYSRPVPYGEIKMRIRDDAAPNPDWDWKLQHGVQGWESLLAWAKGTSWTGDGKWLSNTRAWLEFLDTRTHLPNGTPVADEQFGWPGPLRGTETCVVLQDLFIHATMASLTGEAHFADFIERGFFNAVPACGSRDYMHHVYMQSVNRPDGDVKFFAGPHSHGEKGGAFETTHWPRCCTAAMTRFHGAFVKWMWMKPRTGGVAALLYGPNTLETDVNGVAVRIETKTDYPFSETIKMQVSPASPLKFPLRLRIPEWCVNPQVAVGGEALALAVDGDGFAEIEREWKAGDNVSVKFPMMPKTETMRDYNDSGKPYCSISYGPLLFAYGLPEKDENTPLPGARTDWKMDSSRVLSDVKVSRTALPPNWNWPLASPLRLRVRSAGGEPVELVPYGCAKLRIAMFPDVAGLTSCGGR